MPNCFFLFLFCYIVLQQKPIELGLFIYLPVKQKNPDIRMCFKTALKFTVDIQCALIKIGSFDTNE